MRDEQDKETFLGLLENTDVLLDNFAGGTFEKWGLDRHELRKRFPHLIIATISGYGRTGPMAEYRAYGANINAFTGLTKTWFPHTTHCDWTAVSHVVMGVSAALAHRDRTGEGVLLDFAQTEAACAAMPAMFLGPWNGREDLWSTPNEVPDSHLSRVFATEGDDEWIAVELEGDADVLAAAEFLQIEADAVDAELVAAVDKGLAERFAGELAIRAAQDLQSLGLAAAPVNRVADVFADPQLWSRGALVKVDHPDLGETVNPAPFHRFSEMETKIKWPSRRLGQATSEICAEWSAPRTVRR